MDSVILLLVALAALGVGGGVGLYGRSLIVRMRRQAARYESSRILAQAEEQQKALLLTAKEEALKIRSGAEASVRERHSELQRQERRLTRREEVVESRAESLEEKERGQADRETELAAFQREVEEAKSKEIQRLEAIAGLTMNEARELLFKRAEDDTQFELARRYREVEQQVKEEADQKARRIITLAVHRLAAEVVSESTVHVVPLPTDDMKGRLIGREGRNIRALEAATGVELIIDDTPEAVTISCFDPVRREVARVALTKLIQDGRIHPARIEDMVERARKEVEETIWQEGEQAAFDAGVRGLNPEMIKLLGRLKYRTSYGGNVLRHSVEVAHLAGMLAAEIGTSIEVAKAGGLLHDIGKALSHEVEGPHAEIGGDVARRYGVPHEVYRAIMEHHDEEKGSIEAFLVAAADAISAARPGARKDTLEHYVKRLEALEEVARDFPGVEKTFAIQAGREVRIMVKPESIDDVAASKLARDIVKKIEETLAYPGQIKVMVIRETRSIEYAR